MSWMGAMQAAADYAAADDMMRRYAEGNKAFQRGDNAPFETYQTANGDVPVSYREEGLGEPLIGPEDLVTGGMLGLMKAAATTPEKALAREFASGEANFPRMTRLVAPEYGGVSGQAIMDGNPFIRTELTDKLARTNSAIPGTKGGWAGEAYPYTQRMPKNYKPMKEAGDDVYGRVIDNYYDDGLSGADRIRANNDMKTLWDLEGVRRGFVRYGMDR